jgi:hypothetical protein
MSHLYCYRQKDICDNHIRKSVFSAVSPDIGCSIYSSLPQFVTSMKDFGHIGCLLCLQSVDCQSKVGHHHNSKGDTVLTIFYLSVLLR